MFNRKLKKEIDDQVKTFQKQLDALEVKQYVQLPFKGILGWDGEKILVDEANLEIGEVIKKLIEYLGLEFYGKEKPDGYFFNGTSEFAFGNTTIEGIRKTEDKKIEDCQHEPADVSYEEMENTIVRHCLKCGDHITLEEINPVPSPMPKDKCKCKLPKKFASLICKHGNLLTRNEEENVIPFSTKFFATSSFDLNDIMEWLSNRNYLSESGKKFKTAFWEMFIKE